MRLLNITLNIILAWLLSSFIIAWLLEWAMPGFVIYYINLFYYFAFLFGTVFIKLLIYEKE